MKPSDFLRSAEELLASGEGRPRQTNLRRACSSVYYALFHTLCATCAKMLIGPQGTRRAWTHVYRSVQHRDADENCRRSDMIKRFPPAIQDFALMFSQMQEKRHRADYDPDERLIKSAVETDIELQERLCLPSIECLPSTGARSRPILSSANRASDCGTRNSKSAV